MKSKTRYGGNCSLLSGPFCGGRLIRGIVSKMKGFEGFRAALWKDLPVNQ
jgi:hypothetical protein